MKAYYISDTGKVRTHNEDSVMIVKNLSGQYLLVVADGMGGHKAGEVASSIVVNGLTEKFKNIETIGEKQDAVNWIRENVKELNDAIFKYTDEFEESKGMGTTLVLSIVTDDYILFGNVGDSSGFVFKKGKLYKVTKDHTLVNLLVETGELTKEEAENHPRKNVLMRALGANNPVDVDIFDVEKDCDGILLCSDGLTNMLSVRQIENVLNTDSTLEEKVVKLIRKSNLRGGTDNVSVACLERDNGE
ncbi:MAG: Stp1/IreP family PP2C-type Ser/Thr phosphatase [Bacilli bacterium]|nr:Stp1/IreP family PP2C-type Ser/Thr phosphatase [Bacilli bacterium]